MDEIQTFQDVENFLLDYNQDGTPINEETLIYKSVKKKTIKHYKYINFKIISLFTIILLFIFIYNYLLLNKITIQYENSQTELQILYKKYNILNTEEKGDWEEPSNLLMNGGKKLNSALELMFKCHTSYSDGYNKRGFERWFSAQKECRKLLYYIRYGGF